MTLGKCLNLPVLFSHQENREMILEKEHGVHLLLGLSSDLLHPETTRPIWDLEGCSITGLHFVILIWNS